MKRISDQRQGMSIEPNCQSQCQLISLFLIASMKGRLLSNQSKKKKVRRNSKTDYVPEISATKNENEIPIMIIKRVDFSSAIIAILPSYLSLWNE